MSEGNGWGEWKNLVLADLKQLKHLCLSLERGLEHMRTDLRAEIDKVEDKLVERQHKMQIEIERLKLKSGVWGLMGGLIPAMAIILMKYVL